MVPKVLSVLTNSFSARHCVLTPLALKSLKAGQAAFLQKCSTIGGCDIQDTAHPASIRPQTEAANDPQMSWIKLSSCAGSVSVASGLG